MTRQRCSMRKDDSVRIRHMLDAAQEAVSFVQNRLLIVRPEPCREPIEGLVEGHVLTGVGADPCVCPNVSS